MWSIKKWTSLWARLREFVLSRFQYLMLWLSKMNPVPGGEASHWSWNQIPIILSVWADCSRDISTNRHSEKARNRLMIFGGDLERWHSSRWRLDFRGKIIKFGFISVDFYQLHAEILMFEKFEKCDDSGRLSAYFPRLLGFLLLLSLVMQNTLYSSASNCRQVSNCRHPPKSDTSENLGVSQNRNVDRTWLK
jgi:hypothetical protein